ncbi:hypothetical protein JR316_0001589 [Psilocybe cubensis]|uniref:Uncharacterized protein n=2 Tax=Psilocybe cubensis TaxID=181762 RepID=A0ACB8H9L4_PSICU|nr:hypothetical protein JR316_0001589 [Psilocybe cubensis]KAH9484690.1 hypothetical protein JR316_0001589 [Psilocybe cubensis]
MSSSPDAANHEPTARPRYRAKDWWPDMNSDMSVSPQQSPSPQKGYLPTSPNARDFVMTQAIDSEGRPRQTPNGTQLGEGKLHGSQNRPDYHNKISYSKALPSRQRMTGKRVNDDLGRPITSASPSEDKLATLYSDLANPISNASPLEDKLAALYVNLGRPVSNSLPSEDKLAELYNGLQGYKNPDSHSATEHPSESPQYQDSSTFKDALALIYSNLSPSINSTTSPCQDDLARLYLNLAPAQANKSNHAKTPSPNQYNSVAGLQDTNSSSPHEDKLEALYTRISGPSNVSEHCKKSALGSPSLNRNASPTTYRNALPTTFTLPSLHENAKPSRSNLITDDLASMYTNLGVHPPGSMSSVAARYAHSPHSPEANNIAGKLADIFSTLKRSPQPSRPDNYDSITMKLPDRPDPFFDLTPLYEY